MDQLTPDRLLIVGLFMAALIGVWALVQRNKTGLSKRLSGNRRLHLREALTLGPEGRALLLEAEGRMVLVIGSRRGGGQMLDLGPVANRGAEDAA
ncbi:hypothetical protein [Roseicyclus mahoneyensis]|uniref:Flagellar protein FliO/FliZ n=1 Tax=Roseicyclus mahoneyensis TaxID=164332 RepID=A0A316GHH5_9RHOB|nr:hypothetical protein [Roseicyclus mahoneyensis]PWK60401.1 hypothetical protein C7455_10437 [Roseicyclus mahoneyensis]